RCAMSNATQGERSTQTSPAGVWLGRAWIAVVLIPVFFILAFAVGEVLHSLMGYLPENSGIPLWVDLVATIAAIAVSLVPCTAAVLYGRRANSLGARGGLIPLCVGALAGLGLLILSIVTIIGDHL
ncbi:MAG: hypothetical protein ACXVXY_03905, partial [Mycobacteriaceae bacterium]